MRLPVNPSVTMVALPSAAGLAVGDVDEHLSLDPPVN
jgi:hypothetical protein